MRNPIAFDWPGSGVPFHVSAPLPAELAAVLDAITPVKRKARAGSASRPSAARAASAPGRPHGNSNPTPRSTAHSRISGRPMSALGSVAVDRFAQADPETLALESAGAIEGRFARDIALDRRLIEHAERDARGIDEFEGRRHRDARTTATAVRKATVRPEQLRNCSMQRCAVPGLPRISCSLRAVRQHGDLVGADDPGFRVLRGDRAGLGERQPADQGEAGLAARGAFHRRPGAWH